MKRKKLIDVFPDWFTTGGIFTALSDMPWSDDVTGSTLDIEYYGNVSGEKAVSPLIDKLCDTSGTLPTASINKLADVIKARYEIPWSKLYSTLSIQYNPLHNFKVETTVTPNLEIKKTPNLTHTSTSSNSNTTTYGGTETFTDNTTMTVTDNTTETVTDNTTETVTDNTTETVTDNTTETRTPNLTTEETNEEEIIVSIQNTDESRQYGFNSSEAVPTDETEGDITNTTTKDPTKNVNTTTDTGTETIANTGTTTTANTGSTTTANTGSTTTANTGSTTTANTGTTTTANTGSDTNSGQGLTTTTDTGTDTEKRTGTEKTETEGFRAIYGMQSQQVLLDEERKSWLWQFFDVVFRDVDTVLTIPIYIQ